jgi:hypothetical protein
MRRKKSTKEDIIKGYIETMISANEKIRNRKRFWFEVKNDSDK